MSKKNTNSFGGFDFFEDRLNGEGDDEDIVTMPTAKTLVARPKPVKKPAPKKDKAPEKKTRDDKITKALDGIQYTYRKYQVGKNKQVSYYLTPDNLSFFLSLRDELTSAEPKMSYSELANKMLDEHRVLSDAGFVPDNVNYTFCMYSTKGRNYLSIAFSQENRIYLDTVAKANEFRGKNTAFNKLLDEYRIMWKDMLNRGTV